ncbi:hypothetical protein HDV00_007179 [Rhizophlyctis rosea]|nr:hypothetical protein HDV00_007179 [Rhizophlyctis rosea]
MSTHPVHESHIADQDSTTERESITTLMDFQVATPSIRRGSRGPNDLGSRVRTGSGLNLPVNPHAPTSPITSQSENHPPLSPTQDTKIFELRRKHASKLAVLQQQHEANLQGVRDCRDIQLQELERQLRNMSAFVKSNEELANLQARVESKAAQKEMQCSALSRDFEMRFADDVRDLERKLDEKTRAVIEKGDESESGSRRDSAKSFSNGIRKASLGAEEVLGSIGRKLSIGGVAPLQGLGRRGSAPFAMSMGGGGTPRLGRRGSAPFSLSPHIVGYTSLE